MLKLLNLFNNWMDSIIENSESKMFPKSTILNNPEKFKCKDKGFWWDFSC